MCRDTCRAWSQRPIWLLICRTGSAEPASSEGRLRPQLVRMSVRSDASGLIFSEGLPKSVFSAANFQRRAGRSKGLRQGRHETCCRAMPVTLPQTRALAEATRGGPIHLPAGAPQFFDKYGRPNQPRDLQDFRCILLRQSARLLDRWQFSVDAQRVMVGIEGP